MDRVVKLRRRVGAAAVSAAKTGLKARVGRIQYVNCIPYFHGLQKNEPETEFYATFPAKINGLMHRGKIDMAPVSSLEYLRHQRDYILLPDLGIGARDFSGSVLLLSREKIEGLDGASIALSRESLSSAVLLRILLKFKYKFDNRFVSMRSDPENMLARHKAALVIGDDALFYRPEGFVYKYDLSELWWNWTGKPFCFALWAVRRDFAALRPEEAAAFAARLRKNLNRNLADIEGLIREALGWTFTHEKFSKVFGYLFNLSYGVDPAMKEGLELFFRLAHRLRVAPRPRPIEFLETSK